MPWDAGNALISISVTFLGLFVTFKKSLFYCGLTLLKIKGHESDMAAIRNTVFLNNYLY